MNFFEFINGPALVIGEAASDSAILCHRIDIGKDKALVVLSWWLHDDCRWTRFIATWRFIIYLTRSGLPWGAQRERTGQKKERGRGGRVGVETTAPSAI